MSFEPLQSGMPAAVARLLGAVPYSPGKLQFAWRVAVGPALHRVTTVRLDGGVLTVDAVSRQWAREISRATPLILRRLQTLLGDEVVARVTVHSTD
jgi:hypothetical protein